MIYAFSEDLTLPDNQLLRGEEIFPFCLAKRKEKESLLSCLPSSSPTKLFFRLVKLIVCSSPEAPKKNKV